MQHVSVSILRNTDGRYYPNGFQADIDLNTEILGKRFLAAETIAANTINDISEGEVVPERHPVKKTAVLKVSNPQKGAFYINETEQSLLDKFRTCCTATTTVP